MTMTEAARWYAIQTYSGHENKVKKLIDFRIAEEPGESPEEKGIQEALVPTQEVVEIKNGKRVTVTRRLYPGYVLVKMIPGQRTMHVINKILGLAPVEETAEPREEIPFRSGQVVEVMEGPFTDFTGTVQEVYHDKGKVKVEVSLFGRPTSVELDYTQLKGY
jgi:transcription termination/antitermination protein NusG